MLTAYQGRAIWATWWDSMGPKMYKKTLIRRSKVNVNKRYSVFLSTFYCACFKNYKMYCIASIVLLGENFTCRYAIKQIGRSCKSFENATKIPTWIYHAHKKTWKHFNTYIKKLLWQNHKERAKIFWILCRYLYNKLNLFHFLENYANGCTLLVAPLCLYPSLGLISHME